MAKVFIIPFHVRRMAESIMPPELSGAYVSCYAFGDDYGQAVQKSLQRLSEDGLHPQEIMQPIYEMNSEDWTKHTSEMWADHVDNLPTQAEFDDAIRSGKVVYGPFGSYS